MSIPGSMGVEWIRDSLRAGGGVAKHVLEASPSFSTIEALVPVAVQNTGEIAGFSQGIGISRASSLSAIVEHFQLDNSSSLQTLIVEDDLWRPGDPITDDWDYFVEGDRLVRSADFGPRAAMLLNMGASGYPLNAFLLRPDTRATGTSQLESKCADILSRIQVTISAVFDAESYISARVALRD